MKENIEGIWTIGPKTQSKFKKGSSGLVKIVEQKGDIVNVEDIKTHERLTILRFALGHRERLPLAG